ncbi:hypothetical protein M569_05457 [Genlisea aurea]|uniref:Uncharacterized protein n=1 Tax=Genlisea aurea TaxID=192259 RepID=S8CWI1_9LAMI|nr:hypothetical protein M569_05457 [Genlisea aurea]
MDPEKNLVSITGKFEANLLLKAVSETGKFAEIMWPDGHKNHRSHHEEEEVHRCEEYAPPEFNNRMCRDYYCSDHRQMGMFRNTVPEAAGFHHHIPQNTPGNHYRRRPWAFKEPTIGGGYWPRRNRYDSYNYEGGCSVM